MKNFDARNHMLWVAVITSVIAGAMFYSFYTGRSMAKRFTPLVDAAMEIKFEAAIAHLWFEEMIAGDRSIDVKDVWKHLDQAEWYARAMLEGGENQEGTFVPLVEPILRDRIEQTLEKLSDFRSIALERWNSRSQSGIGSEIDQRFDKTFNDMLVTADDVETALQRALEKKLQRFLVVQGSLIALIIILGAGIGVLLRRHERKRTSDMQTLRESEDLLHRSIINAPIPIILHAEDGEILMVSNNWRELSGYSHAEIPTIQVWIEKAYGTDKKLMKHMREVVKGLYDLDKPDQHHSLVTTASGEKREWQVHDAPLGRLTDGRRFVISMAVDVTDRKMLEAQLSQAQKMESIGQLTGGIAHDFNNLMGVIMGNIEMSEHANTDYERNELLLEAKEAIDKGAALTQQLLSFSRQQTLSPKNAEVTNLVSDSIRLIERTLGEDIEIETNLSEEPLTVKIDAAIFGNALLNLSLNARDAMPGGGKLTIATARIELDGGITGDDNEPVTGPHVLITVSDTGHGMDKDQIVRAVEPFYTTKEVGEGSGLGLSMVYGFMEQSGGHMTIDSEQGKGTTVSLYVPVTDEKTDEDADLEASYETKIQSKTILVVEDDQDVLKITSRILKNLGYQVLEAADGPSAGELLVGRSNEIDLVFSDMVMPKGMNGMELAEWVKGKYDHIKVLLTSGYPDKITDKNYIKSSRVTLLAKPYRRAQLAKAIDDAFNS